jgi:uncharacterized membrane protein
MNPRKGDTAVVFLKWRGRDDVKYGESTGVERINGFSDAVFAVAITLLILTIVVPEVSDIDRLGQELADMWPKFMGFLVSFVIIGAFWMNHHGMFTYLRRSTAGLLRINLLLLMFIVLLPFSTDLMSEYDSSVLAATFYNINMIAVSLVMCLLWWYVSYYGGLVDDSVTPALRRHLLLVYASMAIVFCISIAIAFFSIPASRYFYLSLIPINSLLDHIRRKGSLP